MKRTPNINLPQFEETDRYRLEDYNEAYSIIDKEISDIGTQLDSVNASLGINMIISNGNISFSRKLFGVNLVAITLILFASTIKIQSLSEFSFKLSLI